MTNIHLCSIPFLSTSYTNVIDFENADSRELWFTSKTLKTVQKVEVLGYHTLGVSKWELCEEDYPLKGVPEATKEDVKRAKKILEIE